MKKVAADAEVKETKMIPRTGFDFPVETRDVVVAGTTTVIPGKKAIVRGDNSRVLAIVSDKFKLITHREVVDRFEEGLSKMGDSFKDFTEQTFTPRFGACMMRKYTFPNIDVKMAEKGDIINLTVELLNGYDGKSRVGYNYGAYRLVCTNGLMMGEKFQEILRKHYAKINMDTLTYGLEKGIEVLKEKRNEWEYWRREKISIDRAKNLIEEVRVPKKVKDAIVSRYETAEERSKWGLFQAVTNVVTHLDHKNQMDLRLIKNHYEEAFTPVFYK